MSEPFVVAGGIVRNRAWILGEHLDAVNANRPGAHFYVTGDNTDKTIPFMQWWRAESLSLGHQPELTWLVHNTGAPGYTRDGSDGPRYDSAHMARERNLWASEALKRWPQATHLWVVDSDVLPAPDVLERLLALEAPVAAAFVPIADGVTPVHMMGWDPKREQARRTGEEKLLTKPHAITLCGGSYLIETWLFWRSHAPEKLWKAHPQGEDGGFRDEVEKQAAEYRRLIGGVGIGPVMLVDPLARCEHRMVKP